MVLVAMVFYLLCSKLIQRLILEFKQLTGLITLLTNKLNCSPRCDLRETIDLDLFRIPVFSVGTVGVSLKGDIFRL